MRTGNKQYWITAISLFLVMMFNCGIGYYSLSLFVTPVTREYGITSGDFALLYIFYGIGGGIASVSLHSIVSRFKLKWLLIFGGFISVVGYFIYAFSTSFYIMFVGGMLICASTVFAGTAAVQMMIARWFQERCSQVTGFIAAASGIGAAIGSPIVGTIIRNLGWRTANIVIAVLVAIFSCIQMIFLLKEEPKEVGLLPYGAKESGDKLKFTASETGGYKIREVIKNPNFIMFSVGMIIVAVVYQFISLYQSSILIERGFSEELTAACLSVFATVDMCSKALAGIVTDKKGFRVVTLYCAAGTAMAFVVVRVIGGTTGAILYSALLGFWPTMCVLYGVTASIALFGKQYISEYIGFTQSLMCIGTLAGMPLIRKLYNAIQSFDTIMNIVIGMLVGFMGIMIIVLRNENYYNYQKKHNTGLR